MAKADRTYQARREEGRTKHGTTSMMSIFLGVVGFMMWTMSLFLNSWRANTLGIIGYSNRRSWGLLAVHGFKTRWLHEVSRDTCRFFGELNVGGICNSPVCVWYKLKCERYVDFMMMSYAIAFFIFLALIAHILCIFWTAKFTPRMIRWAGTWWPVVALIDTAGIAIWMWYSETMFDEFDTQSVYPIPPPGIGFGASCLGVLCIITNSVLGCSLWKMWPEVDFEDTSDEEDSDDEGDDEFLKGKKKGAGGPQAQPGFGAQPQAYYAQGGYPPQGYAPESYAPQGYAQEGYPPQGYAQEGYPPQSVPSVDPPRRASTAAMPPIQST